MWGRSSSETFLKMASLSVLVLADSLKMKTNNGNFKNTTILPQQCYLRNFLFPFRCACKSSRAFKARAPILSLCPMNALHTVGVVGGFRYSSLVLNTQWCTSPESRRQHLHWREEEVQREWTDAWFLSASLSLKMASRHFQTSKALIMTDLTENKVAMTGRNRARRKESGSQTEDNESGSSCRSMTYTWTEINRKRDLVLARMEEIDKIKEKKKQLEKIIADLEKEPRVRSRVYWNSDWTS